jgi:hypothetical protein
MCPSIFGEEDVRRLIEENDIHKNHLNKVFEEAHKVYSVLLNHMIDAEGKCAFCIYDIIKSMRRIMNTSEDSLRVNYINKTF